MIILGGAIASASTELDEQVCVTIDTKQGWQEINLPFIPQEITDISGQWAMKGIQQDPVGSLNYHGFSVLELEERKYEPTSPLGSLLVQFAEDFHLWFSQPVPLPIPKEQISTIKLRINVGDRYLAENDGSLRVCFN
jgi:hypothetical protein